MHEKRGVAQMVARLLWEQDAAGSNPVTSTKPNLDADCVSGLAIFVYLSL